MANDDLAEILQTVEAARQRLHPEIDANFLAQVVRIEERNPDDDAAATNAIQAALDALTPAP
ncbi:MAG TPA: hypothetical protein VGO31_07630 [Microbacteriaceae bacterium]|jgi:hypothetical protein|nr:hypothetical protein [Microbacteriaceae bacterium]